KTGPQSIPYSTYLGGSGNDVGTAIAVDRAGRNAYLAGWALSTNFPLKNAFMTSGGGNDWSAFISRFSIESDAGQGMSVANSASWASGPVAPGSLISIFGANLSA